MKYKIKVTKENEKRFILKDCPVCDSSKGYRAKDDGYEKCTNCNGKGYIKE